MFARQAGFVKFVYVAAASGCLPLFPHAPRIEPGLQTGLAYSVHAAEFPPSPTRPADSLVRQVRPAMQGLFWASVGLREDEYASGWRFTASGVFPTAVRADVYRQFSPRWLFDWDAGVGAAFQQGDPGAVSAYASVGRDLDPWRALYATVARTRLGARNESTYRHMTSVTLGYRRNMPRPVNAFVAVHVGRRPPDDCGSFACRPLTLVALGVSIDMRRYTERDGRVLP